MLKGKLDELEEMRFGEILKTREMREAEAVEVLVNGRSGSRGSEW